jgi:hypothetical protein
MIPTIALSTAQLPRLPAPGCRGGHALRCAALLLLLSACLLPPTLRAEGLAVEDFRDRLHQHLGQDITGSDQFGDQWLGKDVLIAKFDPRTALGPAWSFKDLDTIVNRDSSVVICFFGKVALDDEVRQGLDRARASGIPSYVEAANGNVIVSIGVKSDCIIRTIDFLKANLLAR